MGRKKKSEPETLWVSEQETRSRELLEAVEAGKKELEAYYPRLLEEDLTLEAETRAASWKRTAANLSRGARMAYDLQDELRARARDARRQKKKNLLSRPSNASVDLRERELNHFARGLNLYKLLLLCFVGSFAGVIIEMLWCLVTNGYLESRAGLVYGPFNLLYGLGAVGLTLCLYRFRNRGAWISFLGGIIVGSVVEYGCSWFQETLFGSRSWDYSHMPFNLNGRICLLYSIFWGILAVLWIKNLYPRLAGWILKIPNRPGKIITWVLTAFFAVNACMSCISVARWSQRRAGIEPSNGFWEVIDRRFPDERMERIYANMEFGD